MPLSLEIARAEGIYLYDTEGRRYADLISGIGVSALGHGHPAVVSAVRDQAGRYMHTMVYGEYVLAPQVRLAHLLAEQLPESLDSVYLVNSGAEATEGAMKLAKRTTGRSEFVSMYDAYHGSTQGALSLMSDEYFTAPFRPLLPGVRHIRFNCDWCLNEISEQTAAVIVEPVQAEAGVVPGRTAWLAALRKRCTEVGALLVFDEIQTGCGRTGSLFAFQSYGVVPDILLLAKGFGGGMPIGAFVAGRELMSGLSHDPVLGHITTFGGHPVSAAAAWATLNELVSDPALIGGVAAKAALFKTLLAQHPAVLDFRQAGLMMALELDSFDRCLKTIRVALERGLIVDWFLFNNRSLRLAPPLVISEPEIRDCCRLLRIALDQALLD